MFLFCFFGMVMNSNEVETKEKEKLPEIKNELQQVYNYTFYNNILYYKYMVDGQINLLC